MSDSSSLQQTFHWLASHSGVAGRLPPKAELLVLVAAAAALEESGPSGGQAHGSAANANFTAQMRNYSIQRRRVHYKCDNSAKV